MFYILLVIVALYVFLYTVSYGFWELKHSKLKSAIFSFIVCIVELILPIYLCFVTLK